MKRFLRFLRDPASRPALLMAGLLCILSTPFLLALGIGLADAILYYKPNRIFSAERAKFANACPAFQNEKLPTGTTLLASRVEEEDRGRTSFITCMAVYQFTGSQAKFKQAMEKRFRKMNLPESTVFKTDEGGWVAGAHTGIYFATDKSSDPEIPEETVWNMRSNISAVEGWTDIEYAMRQPKTALTEYVFEDFSEWTEYGMPPHDFVGLR